MILFTSNLLIKMKTNRFYSPTDLIRFMESPFASWMNRYALEFPHLAPEKDPQDALSCALQKRGFAHEDQLEMSFREQGLSVVKIEGESNTEKQAATLSSTQQGADIIVQARLEMNGFRGFADFLIKTPGDSLLGDFHYEVWDTKLSRHLKPAHAIQLCCYAEMLEAIQGPPGSGKSYTAKHVIARLLKAGSEPPHA